MKENVLVQLHDVCDGAVRNKKMHILVIHCCSLSIVQSRTTMCSAARF